MAPDNDKQLIYNKTGEYREDIDGFDEDVLLRKLSCDVDLRIEPHSFARTDFDETDPYIKEIVETGERIL